MTAEQDAAARELLEIFADTLEHSHGQCVHGRETLMKWLDEQFLRLAMLNAPDHAAGEMVNTAYMHWQAESLGIDV